MIAPSAPDSAAVAQPKWNGGIAALLSLIIPGAGQMYKGQVGNGLVWLIFVAIGYFMLVVPGLILHLFCIIGAASGDPTK
jgi:TM2 domain-containing membrane protein YozV